MSVVRKSEIFLEFQDYIPGPPLTTAQLYQQACSGDGVTIEAWRETWLRNTQANKERFGSFADNGIGRLFNSKRNRPVIIAGSGPSLKYNAHKLKDRGDIGLVSCLHNFHFMEDLGANVDLYVTLDAGPVTIEEVSEGGKKSADEYWAITKDRTLAAFIGTDPELLRKWQGKILFYNCPVPDHEFDKAMDAIEPFNTYVSAGGNVLGCCLYIAKIFLGANPIIFIGADFSFGYEHSEKTGKPKFHAWNSKYDQGIGNAIRAVDVFGNKVKTWPSYWNFKCFFDRTAVDVPGIWINATEGGLLGAYPDGNISAIRQMTLDTVLEMYSIPNRFEGQALRPAEQDKRVCY